jgi:S-adenosylmethionine uptake transporter
MLSLYGWTAFAFMDAMAKWLSITYPVSEIIFITNSIGLIFIFFWILVRHGWKGFVPNNFKLHIIRAAVTAISAILVVNSFARIPLADFYGIIFLSPLLTSLAAVFFLKEHFHKQHLLAILAGFTGVLILAGPQFSTLNIGILCAFGAVICIVANALLMRKIGSEKIFTIYAFYPFIFNSALNAPLIAQDFVMPTISVIPVFIALTALMVMGMATLSLAYARASGASVIAPFHYCQILWGVILGYLIFGDIPSISTATGIVIIVSAGIYLISYEKRPKTAIEAS